MVHLNVTRKQTEGCLSSAAMFCQKSHLQILLESSPSRDLFSEFNLDPVLYRRQRL